MRPPSRWPLHPVPREAEALSSWLHRIADGYAMTVAQLLAHGLGEDPTLQDGLDLDPPARLLLALAERTGIEPARLPVMSLAGWTPWLLDSLEPRPESFQTYVRQFSVLLPPGKRSTRRVGPWRAWIPDQPVRRACPVCEGDPHRQGLLLTWQLPLQLSCPEHGCLLEPCIGRPGKLSWVEDDPRPHDASGAVQSMDRRTHDAVTTGHVLLPRRRVHAAIWFRLLRTLLDEISTPVTYWGAHADDLRRAWASCGQPIRAGQTIWRPFEDFPWPTQAHLLQAAAATIELLDAGDLIGRGPHAYLFTTTPVVPVDAGRPPGRRSPNRPTMEELWAATRASLEEAIEAARHDPKQAQALYNVMVYACHTPPCAEQVLTTMAEVGIPTDQLSLKQFATTVHDI